MIIAVEIAAKRSFCIAYRHPIGTHRAQIDIRLQPDLCTGIGIRLALLRQFEKLFCCRNCDDRGLSRP